MASRCTGSGSRSYDRQNLPVARLCVGREWARFAGAKFFHRLFGQMIELPSLRVRFDLAIPRVVEVDLGEFVEKLALLPFVETFHGLDNLSDSAHGGSLAGSTAFVTLRVWSPKKAAPFPRT